MRSVGARRALIGRVALFFGVFGLALALAGPWAAWFASPGDLSVHHARQMRATARGDAGCRDCHVAAEGAAAFTASVFGSTHDRDESGLCLDCHDLGEHASKAHGVDPVRLARGAAPAVERDFLCVTCHDEHRGAGASLTELDDVQCQACHQERFDSFASGHPELDGYPHETRSVVFDHEAHRSQYFTKERNSIDDRVFRCHDCHEPDRARESMILKPYDETCASCHDEQIATSGDVDFVTLIGLDTIALDDADVRIGLWPSEEEPAPSYITEMLLRGDENGGAYVDVFRSLDPLDLGAATDDELRAVEDYAWGVKRLLAELRDRGRVAVMERVARSLSEPLTEKELARLVGAMPHETVAAAARTWFPVLDEDIEGYSDGRPPPTELVYPEPTTRPVEPGAGEWHRDDYEMRLLYRPAGHADPLLRAWIELAAENESSEPLYQALTGEFAAGRCTKCHALDPEAIRWTSGRERATRDHVRFSHAPHVSLFTGADRCESCHRFGDSDAPEAGADVRLQEFLPLQKQRCASCHRQDAAPDSCLTCHIYHVGSAPVAER